jgi:hypothetical protein
MQPWYSSPNIAYLNLSAFRRGLILLLFIIIIYLNCKWGSKLGSGATIRHNTQKYTYHTNNLTLKQNTAHKERQTI